MDGTGLRGRGQSGCEDGSGGERSGGQAGADEAGGGAGHLGSFSVSSPALRWQEEACAPGAFCNQRADTNF
jgi:hypothetical protein